MNKEFLKSIIQQLGLSQAGFARAIGIDSALLRKQLMDNRHKVSRAISPNVKSEAMSLLAYNNGQMPEWAIGMDVDKKLNLTTIHHNIYPRFTGYSSELETIKNENILIIWHSHINRLSDNDINNWVKKAKNIRKSIIEK